MYNFEIGAECDAEKIKDIISKFDDKSLVNSIKEEETHGSSCVRLLTGL